MSREAKHLAGHVGHAKLPETHNFNGTATATILSITPQIPLTKWRLIPLC